MECAVLFADVAGSTALYELLGDERAFMLVESCLSAMSDCTAELHGRVVKTIGDAVMAVFPSADAAAAAACEMQLRVERLGPAAGVRLSVRVGLRYGPVVERDHDVFGDTVNLASRLCDLASKGQIVTDEDTAQRLSQAIVPSLRRLYSVPVKGKEQEVALIEILWQAAAEDRTAIVAAPTSTGAPARLVLELDGASIEMGPQRRKVTFGRDLEADFTIRHPKVSRAHAMIERRRDRFVLVDHSSNGTFVSFEGRPETTVHHEELALMGHGWIAFGQPRAEAGQVATFSCVQGPEAATEP
ncbi:adenylate/guanylate cyclase domain-containing protein [Ideonella sp. A 288]|uniref:adenylate/guanylate cyclase domain-containing protein n=1 Tax=Ideonella sp. A 288 TaxID=1962181 RepID=UPI0013032A2E|nr:adenylate/guanylate cyclase domain-containing protein [Ideonella sp. A 288]